MWRQLFSALLGLAALAALAASPAPAERALEGNVLLFLDGNFSPRTLPRHRPVPVTVRFDGSIQTTDGSHPPSLRRLRIALNRHGSFSTAGLPRCSARALQSTSSAAALRACGKAKVGDGSFRAEIEADSGAVPARGRLLVFSAREGGRPALLLHLHASVPIDASFVLPLRISRRPRGTFGTVLTARLPRLAGGLGSITNIHLRLGRTYRHQGRRHSVIAGSCAAPAGFSIGPFPFARARFGFADGTHLAIGLTRFCRVR